MRHALLPAVVAVLVLVGCGSAETDPGSTGESPAAEPPKTHTTAAAAPKGPRDCLAAAGLDNIERRDSDLWRGFDPGSGIIVLAERMSSAVEAQDAARLATAVRVATAGRWYVHGGVKTADDGANVRLVAACLGQQS